MMYTKIQIDKSKEGQINETIASSFQELRERKILMKTSRKSVKGLKEYNLMKQLASKIIYQRTDKSINNEATQTELTEKTEYSLHGSIYRLVQKTPTRKRKHYSINQVLKQNGSLLHYSNTCKMINGNTTKLIRNKLTLHKKSKKIIKKRRLYRREKSLPDVIKSLEKLIRGINRNMGSNEVVEEFLQWSLTSTYKSVIRQNDWNLLRIQPVPIVPPLPLPMWNCRAMEEMPPMMVTLRRTPSLAKTNEPRPLKSKVIMKGRSRKHKACMISAEALARALNPQRFNKGPRQVPVSTFRATRIHYRFLLAKYGKARLLGRRRVYPNVIKPTVHSNFSVINLLHEVEEAISHNKYSKETDRIVRNFKEELNKDLLFTEPINGKSHKNFAFNTSYSTTTKKKSKFTNQCCLSYLEHIETVCGNDNISANQLDNDIESDFEIKSNITEDVQQKSLVKSKLYTKSTTDLDSTGIISKSFGNEHRIIDTLNKINSKNEDIEVSKFYNQKRSLIKDKISMKKKRIFGREYKTEYLTEEERLNAVIQELQKQVKIPEPPTHLLLAENDSLTEINFEQEPITYINMPDSPSTTDTVNNQPKESDLQLIGCILPDLSQLVQPESSFAIKEVEVIKEKKSKKKHSSTKGFTFRIDYECIKNKALNIFNILIAINRVNKLLQNIPVQYDESGDQPYIVYDPKSIHKVVKEVNTKHEFGMIVKKNKKKKCETEETASSIYDYSETNESQVKNTQDEIEINEEPGNFLNAVGNQLLNCILKSIETELQSSESTESQTVITYTECASEITQHKQVFDNENPRNHNTLEPLYNISNLSYTSNSNSSNDAKENRVMIRSSLTGKITRYLKKCSHQLKNIEINYQITGIYYQAITYMESKTYFVPDHSVPQHIAVHSEILSNINRKEKEEEKTNMQCTIKSRYLENTKSNQKDYNQPIKINKNIPLELIKKYQNQPRNQNNNRFINSIHRKSMDDILKHYNQYNRTKKYIKSKNDFMRKYENQRNKLAEKYGNNHEDRNDKNSRSSQNDVNQKDWHTFKHNTFQEHNQQYNNKNERQNISQSTVSEKPTKSCDVAAKELIKSVSYESNKSKETLKGTETILLNKNMNPSPYLGNIEQVHPNQYYVFNSTKNECSRNISTTASIMKNILRSASINTMQNNYPRRMDVTKQVFYFQITQPINPEFLNIFKKQSTDQYFLPFIDNKCNSNKRGNFQAYKKNINEQVMDCINIIKDELNENIENICKISNINRQLLKKFLKICLQKDEFHLENDLDELKSEMKKQFGKQMYPLNLVTRQEERVKKEWKMITFKNSQMSDKTKQQLVLKNVDGIKKHNEAITHKNLSLQILSFFNFLMFIFNLITIFWV